MGEHWDIRHIIIGWHNQQLPAPKVMLVGDSITEANVIRTLGTNTVLNAGYGGINALGLYYKAYALAAMAPAHTYLMVGTNDANDVLGNAGVAWWNQWNASQTVLYNVYETWRETHANIIQAFTGANIPLTLMTCPPVEVGASAYRLGLEQINRAVRFIGMAWSIPVIDVEAALIQPNGYAAPGSTVDGIHPTPATYNIINGMLV